MKTLYSILLLTLFVLPSALFAEETKTDTLHIKNKKVVRTFVGDTVFIDRHLFDDIDNADILLNPEEYVPVSTEAKIDYDSVLCSYDYPDFVLDGSISGTVYVNILVGRSSKILKMFVSYSDESKLNDIAMEAVLNSNRYEPADYEGSKIASWLSVPIVFAVTDTTIVYSFYVDNVLPVSCVYDIWLNLRPKFIYPEYAKINKMSGKIDFEILIDENGKTLSIITAKSNNPALEKEARNVITGHKFLPNILNDGTRTKALFKLPVEYRM